MLVRISTFTFTSISFSVLNYITRNDTLVIPVASQCKHFVIFLHNLVNFVFFTLILRIMVLKIPVFIFHKITEKKPKCSFILVLFRLKTHQILKIHLRVLEWNGENHLTLSLLFANLPFAMYQTELKIFKNGHFTEVLVFCEPDTYILNLKP
jgi:hypothetical protein